LKRIVSVGSGRMVGGTGAGDKILTENRKKRIPLWGKASTIDRGQGGGGAEKRGEKRGVRVGELRIRSG